MTGYEEQIYTKNARKKFNLCKNFVSNETIRHTYMYVVWLDVSYVLWITHSLVFLTKSISFSSLTSTPASEPEESEQKEWRQTHKKKIENAQLICAWNAREVRERETKKGKFMHANEVDKEKEKKFNLNIQQKCRVFGTKIYTSTSTRSESFLLFSYR